MKTVRARRPYLERTTAGSSVAGNAAYGGDENYYIDNYNENDEHDNALCTENIRNENALADIAEQERKALRQRRAAMFDIIKGALYYSLFIGLFLLLPIYLIVKLTPFFVFENLQCRLSDKLWNDKDVVEMEKKYANYFSSPPLHGSDAFNKSMWWGTYEPSRIFAIKNRANAGNGTLLGIAWYDTIGKHPVRHLMYTMHNKVNAARQSTKQNRDPEVMRVRWIAHDGIHYAKQYIEDFANKAAMEVEFLKSPSGDSWHVRLHAIVESDNALDVVLYLVNDELTNDIDVLPPSTDNNGDWSPTLISSYVNHKNETTSFALRVYDDHNPLYDTAPWRIYGLQVDPNDAFSLRNPLQHGGGPAERAALEGKGLVVADIKDESEENQKEKKQKHKGVFQFPSTTLNLRELPHNAFTFIDSVESKFFHRPITSSRKYSNYDVDDADDHSHHGHLASSHHTNMIVMKKAYDSSFRLEVSFTPLDDANKESTSEQNTKNSVRDTKMEHDTIRADSKKHSQVNSYEAGTSGSDKDENNNNNKNNDKLSKYDTHQHTTNKASSREMERKEYSTVLSTCQLTNTFRRRNKAIVSHAKKVTRPWVSAFNRSHSYYELLALQLMGELFGSISFTSGQYLISPFTVQELEEIKSSSEQEEKDGQKSMPHTERTSMKLRNEFSEFTLSPSTVSALASLGSRTDDPVGTYSITGVQLLFLVRWNKEIVKDIISSWLIGAQDAESGFIPTHTTFNKATRSLTMPSARVEHHNYGNPPTLLFGIEELLQEMKRKQIRIKTANKRKRRNTGEYYEEEKKSDMQFLQTILPALKKWRHWWHTTQCGGLTLPLARNCHIGRRRLEEWPPQPTGKAEDALVYRWRGRIAERLPTSGMQDYPRVYCADESELEGHLDLFTWIAMLSRLISKIEVEFLHITESVTLDWEAYLDAVHWDSEHHRYADRRGCTDGGFSQYTGYVNLFPVITGVLQHNVDKISETVKIAQNELVSDYGLMSVSFDSVKLARENHLSHDHLWMGYVWPSVNAMFLYSLKTNYLSKKTANNLIEHAEVQKLYEQLRIAMTETMQARGRWWEFYNPVDGRGEGSKTYIGSYSLLLTLLDRYE